MNYLRTQKYKKYFELQSKLKLFIRVQVSYTPKLEAWVALMPGCRTPILSLLAVSAYKSKTILIFCLKV